MGNKGGGASANYSAEHHNEVRRAKKLKDRAHRGLTARATSQQFILPATSSRQQHIHPGINHQAQADNAYLALMKSDHAPAVGSLEHRAVLLFRDHYVSARPNGVSSKSQLATAKVFEQLTAKAGLKELPGVLAKEVHHGLRKMRESLVAVYDTTVAGCGHSCEQLIEAVDKLLVIRVDDSPASRSMAA